MEDRDFSTDELKADVSPTIGDTQHFLDYHKTLCTLTSKPLGYPIRQ